MGAIEAPAIGILGGADAPAGLALSTEAGWNQTEADWRLFLRRGTVYGSRGPDGRVLATAAILPYGRSAWISMVLVTATEQRRGLATALMALCLSQAEEAGWQTWLDATPAGAAVYPPLGFRPVGELVRLRRPAAAATAAAPRSVELSVLIAADRNALGVDRAPLLREFAARPGSFVFGDPENCCCLVREGLLARHIGPVYGRSGAAVNKLLADVAASVESELVIDLHADRAAARHLLGTIGFAGERPFTRMARGLDARSIPDAAFASAGPEFG